MTGGTEFASSSLTRHLVRGVLGFGSAIAAVLLFTTAWPVSLVLLALGALALRGCPMCWMIGLAQTLSRGRLQRECSDGVCRLTTAGSDGAA